MIAQRHWEHSSRQTVLTLILLISFPWAWLKLAIAFAPFFLMPNSATAFWLSRCSLPFCSLKNDLSNAYFMSCIGIQKSTTEKQTLPGLGCYNCHHHCALSAHQSELIRFSDFSTTLKLSWSSPKKISSAGVHNSDSKVLVTKTWGAKFDPQSPC